MHVLWTHNFDPGIQNSGVFVHTLAKGVRARGVDLQLEYLGNLRSIPALLRARKRVRNMARDFDVVHAQYGSACAMVTAAAADTPKVLTIRGSDWQTLDFSPEFLYFHSRLAVTLSKAAIGHYDCVIAVSRRISAELAEHSPDTRLEVLPSAIDLSCFVPLDKREARKLLGYSDSEEKWILFNSGDLRNPVKRLELAKQAFELAAAWHGNLRLQLATGLPHEKVPLLTAACDVILCTSENEGWPNSIKEALACNVPFVATDVGDLRDIANLESRCRICAADAQAIADNICEVLADPESQDLRKHVQHMSLDEVSEQLVSIYESVI